MRSSCAILLLFSYLAGNTSFGIFHELFHKQGTSVSHSPDQERDVCHRAIYHFGKDPSHKSHLVVNEKSDKCNLVVHTDQISLRPSSDKTATPSFIITETLSAVQFSDISVLLPSRAPPVL